MNHVKLYTIIGQAETGYGCATYGDATAYNSCETEESSPGSNPTLADTGQSIIVSSAFSLIVIAIAVYLLITTNKKHRKDKK